MFSAVSVCFTYDACTMQGLSSSGPPPQTYDLTVLAPAPASAPPLLVTSGGQDWRHVQTYLLEDTLPRYLVATAACTSGKQAVCTLLECFFVYALFWSVLNRLMPFSGAKS